MKKRAEDAAEHYDIKILRNGTWLYGGTPINRHNLVKLFASVLHKDAEGRFWLITPAERGLIEVEDAPFTAVELAVDSPGTPAQTLRFRTNLDAWVTAGPQHPIRVVFGERGEPAPYLMVRDGLEARISRAVYYQLAELAVEQADRPGRYGVYSGGEFFAIGQI
ncbi:MAG TPA: DUF1285 domain-containing protein [Patescibacteria group bacterium]|nr:DUF1285 domain-containing protein [Patescibacteria group bacterium]